MKRPVRQEIPRSDAACTAQSQHRTDGIFPLRTGGVGPGASVYSEEPEVRAEGTEALLRSLSDHSSMTPTLLQVGV